MVTAKTTPVKKAPAQKVVVQKGTPSPPPEDLKDIDRKTLVKLVLERLTSEGKSVQSYATEIGMPVPVAEVVFQGSSLPAWRRVRQFLEYLGLESSAAPKIDSTIPRPKGNHIFISYCHKDSEYLERLLVHLKPLQRDGVIDAWVDTRLQAGDRWRKEIDAALRKARAAVLLISADFLASDFVFKNELPPLLKAAEEQGTLIIPVVLKPCRFVRSKELCEFQSINPPDEPLSVLDENGRELLYDSVAQRIEAAFS